MPNDLQIQFPAATAGTAMVPVPPLPEAAANTGLEAYAKQPESVQTLTCRNLLVGPTLQQAQQDATTTYQEMLDNPQVFMTYGKTALQGVNDLITRLLHQVEPAPIDELEKIMSGLNDGMRSIKHKYDVSDPNVREKYKHWKGGILRFVGNGRTLLQMLLEDATSVEHQLDKVSTTLGHQMNQLLTNVSYYDELYKENEAAIEQLIYVIAVMELIHDLAAAAAGQVEVGNSALGDRGQEKKANLVEFASNMEIKISEYKGRLLVAWATSPQVRTMRTLNVSLAEKLNELDQLGIPTMKLTIVQWEMMVQSQDSARMNEAISNSVNETLQQYAESSAVAVGVIANQVNTPMLTPESIAAMADSIGRQADEVISALNEGRQRRADMDKNILKAKGVFDDATARVSAAFLQDVVTEATRPLEIATSVPASAGQS